MKKLYYGAAYYPELWGEDVIAEDIRIMKEVGVNVVRMGEFAWSRMEPHEGQISLDFFVDIINRLAAEGIETVFCTPTPTPPIWVSHDHPERMLVNDKGVRMGHGARQHCCTNNDYFRQRSRIIIEALAKAVGKLPGVIAWQTDNEFKCHVAECVCESCKGLWHEWLAGRYGTIEKLNDAWGAAIWSEEYESFEQVPQLGPTPFAHNTSLQTAYRIFSCEKIAEYQKEQLDIIRKYSDAPITHNTNLGFRLDNELLFADLDFASFDAYPDCDNYEEMLFNYDLWRTVKKGRPFWLMETSTSYNGCIFGYHKPHRTNFLTAEAVSAYAFGAQGFSHWLWRQQKSGVEQTHGAVVSSWGEPSLGYGEVHKARQASRQIESVITSTEPMQGEVAITYSDMARVFFTTEPMEGINYTQQVRNWYSYLLDAGLHRDLIFEGACLDGYKLLFTPFMPYVSPEYLAKAKTFVESGGVWVVGPLTGGRTKEHTVHTDAALGELESLAGVRTVFTYPMTNTDTKAVAFDQRAELGLWSSVFEPVDGNARVLGTIEEGITPGLAFISERQLGKGKIIMLGSMPQGEQGSALLKKLIDYSADLASVNLRFDVSEGTVVAPRIGDDGLVWIVINMDGKGGRVSIPEDAVDLVTGKKISAGELKIGQYEYRVVKIGY